MRERSSLSSWYLDRKCPISRSCSTSSCCVQRPDRSAQRPSTPPCSRKQGGSTSRHGIRLRDLWVLSKQGRLRPLLTVLYNTRVQPTHATLARLTPGVS